MNAACEMWLLSLTPVALASPFDVEDELLVPVVVDAPPVVAPAIAPTELFEPELPEALLLLQTFAALFCSAAFTDDCDDACEDPPQSSGESSALFVDADFSAAFAD